jgi:integrase
MSVRKRTWTTKKGTNKEAWVVDYVDQTGKRHLKTFNRKKEADAYHSYVNVEVSRGEHTPESESITVAEATRLWIASGERACLEQSTLTQYRQHADLHIIPYLGMFKLAQLSAPLIRDFEDKLRSGTPAPGHSVGVPRSAAMARKILVSLGSILADAQERGKVARNAVRDLRSRRKRGKERRAERRQRRRLQVGVDIPSLEEIRAILAALKDRWRPVLLTAIFTGLRASELRGLRWGDVDFKRGELHVRQRVDRYKSIGPPKSESGQRTVPLPPIVLNALREWKIACPKGELDLAFPSESGQIEHHKNIVSRGLIPAQLAAGVTECAEDEHGKPLLDRRGSPVMRAKYALHSLRHFYASWCINRRLDGGLELPPKLVQERLGHSSIMMTMDAYGHLFPRGDDLAELAAAERTLLG